MIRKTDDLPSDICNHARSIIIQEVSQVTMEKFMSQFNIIIARAVLERPDPFYQGLVFILCNIHLYRKRSSSIKCRSKSNSL
jgi:hypothetical protein